MILRLAVFRRTPTCDKRDGRTNSNRHRDRQMEGHAIYRGKMIDGIDYSLRPRSPLDIYNSYDEVTQLGYMPAFKTLATDKV